MTYSRNIKSRYIYHYPELGLPDPDIHNADLRLIAPSDLWQGVNITYGEDEFQFSEKRRIFNIFQGVTNYF